MSEHTNLPWRTDGYAVFDAEGYEVCDPSQGPHLHETHTGNNGHWASTEGSHIERDEATEEALAAYIVTAANAYPALVEALEAMIEPYNGFDDFQLERRTDEPTFRAIKQAKLVLALQSTQARKG